MLHKVPEDVVIEKRVNVSQDRITVRAINPSYGPVFPKFHDNHFIPAFNLDDIRSHVINPRKRCGFGTSVFVSPLKRLAAVFATAEHMQGSFAVCQGELASAACTRNFRLSFFSGRHVRNLLNAISQMPASTFIASI
jgi:hypothetical protein